MKSVPRVNISLSWKELFSTAAGLIFPGSLDSTKETSRFETEFGRLLGFPRGVVFAKARVGLYYLLRSLSVGDRKEVVLSGIHVPDFVNVIRCAGFVPVVADLDDETWGIDYADLKKKVGPSTALILVTHLAALPTDMDRVLEIARDAGHVPIVEDCSQAVIGTYRGRKLGTFGVAAIYSLGLLKPVCTLFGGMVLANDEGLLGKLREYQAELRAPGRIPLLMEVAKNLIFKLVSNRTLFGALVHPWLKLFSATQDLLSRYQIPEGKCPLRDELPQSYFIRMSGPQARLGLSQLQTVLSRENARAENGRYLYLRLGGKAELVKPRVADLEGAGFWLLPIRVPGSREVKAKVARRGIDTCGFLLSSLGDEQAFQSYGFSTPGASRLKRETLFVPIHGYLARRELDEIARAFESAAAPSAVCLQSSSSVSVPKNKPEPGAEKQP